MKSIYFLIVLHAEGGKAWCLCWGLRLENSKPKKPEGSELWSGATALLWITSKYPWCLVPREVHWKIKNLRGKSKVCPRHPLRTSTS
jgi:hypothetical protein